MRKIIIAMLVLTLFQGCIKHHCENEEPLTNAVVSFTGKLEVDGCDWVIKTDASTTPYHADNLPDSYKVNDLNVRVSFRFTGELYTCGWNGKLQVIHITHIEK